MVPSIIPSGLIAKTGGLCIKSQHHQHRRQHNLHFTISLNVSHVSIRACWANDMIVSIAAGSPDLPGPPVKSLWERIPINVKLVVCVLCCCVSIGMASVV
jgi:hypothetical protein